MRSEWDRQLKVFNQSRWAATQLARADMRLQGTMNDIEIWIRMRERARLAREIHDTVEYALTAMHVQLSAIKELLKTDTSSLEKRIGQLEKLVQTTMYEVQNEVQTLRNDELEPWPTKWEHMCTLFSDSTGVRVHLDIPKDLGFIDENLGAVVTRMIQEGLTNAYRHSRADYVDVAIRYKDAKRTLLLRISDNGAGSEHVEPGSGLRGITERVEGSGGSVAWETEPGRGFDLGIVLPVDGSAELRYDEARSEQDTPAYR